MERIPLDEVINNKTINYIQHYNRYRFAKIFTHGNIADIACGIGYGAKILDGSYRTYLGIDINPESINTAQNIFQNSYTFFEVGDIYKLNDKKNSFDVVISTETLEHLDNPDKGIESAASILKDDGLYIGSVPAKFYDDLIVQKFQPNEFHHFQFNRDLLREKLTKFFKNVIILIGTEDVITSFIPINELTIKSMEARLFDYTRENDYGSYFFLCSNSDTTFNNVQKLLSKKIILNSAPFMKVYFDNYHNQIIEQSKLITILNQQLDSVKEDLLQSYKHTQNISQNQQRLQQEIDSYKQEMIVSASKNEEKENFNQVQMLEKLVNDKNNEILIMRNSKFWKARNMYTRIKSFSFKFINDPRVIFKVARNHMPNFAIPLGNFYNKIKNNIEYILMRLRLLFVKQNRIAMVCSTGALGGAERVFGKHVEMLCRDYDVDVFFEIMGGPIEQELRKLPIKISVRDDFNEFNLAKHKYLYLVQSIPNLKLIKRYNPNIKISFILHDPILWTEQLKKNFDFIGCIDHFFCISELIKDKLLQQIPSISPQNVSVLYNSLYFGDGRISQKIISDRKRDNANQAYVFGYAGRFSYEKNILEIIKTFKNLKKRYTNIKLILAGDISLKDDKGLQEYKKKITDLMSDDPSIEYMGFQSDLNDFYNKVNAYIIASFIEGISVSALDAHSFGIPVISSNVGSMHEIINDDNGVLFDLEHVSTNPFDDKELKFSEKDSVEFLNAMEHCMQKKWNHSEISKSTVSKFSEENIKKKFLSEIKSIIK